MINKPAHAEQQEEVQPAVRENSAEEYADLQRQPANALSKVDEAEKIISSLESDKQRLMEELRRQKDVFETYQEEKGREIDRLKMLEDVGNSFNSYFSVLKQWCSEKEYYVKITDKKSNDYQLEPYTSDDNIFDPIEIYAYYLGLYINNMYNGFKSEVKFNAIGYSSISYSCLFTELLGSR